MDAIQEPQRLRAFVIGPIGDRDAEDFTKERIAYEQGLEVLEHVIAPACRAIDIESFRADQISTIGEIPEQVFRYLRDSHIVIADLTDANPNVMYELGLRHTTGKLTIQIGERNRLPFDVSTIRTILFKRTEIGFVEARRSLVRALAEGLESGGDPVTATRVWFEIEAGGFNKLEQEEDERGAETEEEDEEAGFLELIAETEAGIGDISQTLNTGGSILGEVTRILQDGTAKIESLPASGNYSAAKLAVANRIAASLEDPALRLRIVAQDYARHVERANPGMLYMLHELENSPDQIEQAGEFIDSISGLVQVAIEQRESVGQFVLSMRQGGNATRSMKKVTQSLINSSERIGDASGVIASWQESVDRVKSSIQAP